MGKKKLTVIQCRRRMALLIKVGSKCCSLGTFASNPSSMCGDNWWIFQHYETPGGVIMAQKSEK